MLLGVVKSTSVVDALEYLWNLSSASFERYSVQENSFLFQYIAEWSETRYHSDKAKHQALLPITAKPGGDPLNIRERAKTPKTSKEGTSLTVDERLDHVKAWLSKNGYTEEQLATFTPSQLYLHWALLTIQDPESELALWSRRYHATRTTLMEREPNLTLGETAPVYLIPSEYPNSLLHK